MKERGSIVTAIVLTVGLVAVGCSAADEAVGTPESTTGGVNATPETAPASGCADVVAAAAEAGDDGLFTFTVTVRSADTGDEKYADAWEVRGPDGVALATRVLAHPHVGEQPFTRSLSGVEVPTGITTVEVAARDSVSGFCGVTLDVAMSTG